MVDDFGLVASEISIDFVLVTFVLIDPKKYSLLLTDIVAPLGHSNLGLLSIRGRQAKPKILPVSSRCPMYLNPFSSLIIGIEFVEKCSLTSTSTLSYMRLA